MVKLTRTYLEIAPVVNPTRYEDTFFSSMKFLENCKLKNLRGNRGQESLLTQP
jgi:hypothetical protein